MALYQSMLRFIDPKVDEPCAGINHLPLHNQHISYNSIHRTQDVILHFHGFKNKHQVALFNGIAGMHLDTDDPARHRRLHVARKSQRSAGLIQGFLKQPCAFLTPAPDPRLLVNSSRIFQSCPWPRPDRARCRP